MEHHTWSTTHGASHMRHHTWGITHGALHMEHHTWSITHGASHMEHHTWSITHEASHIEHHTWSITHGAPHMEHHTWSITHWASHMEHHTWNITHGASHMEHHTWSITHGASHMGHHTWSWEYKVLHYSIGDILSLCPRKGQKINRSKNNFSSISYAKTNLQRKGNQVGFHERFNKSVMQTNLVKHSGTGGLWKSCKNKEKAQLRTSHSIGGKYVIDRRWTRAKPKH